MREIEIDVSAHTSKDLTGFVGQQFDYVITVCDRVREACPVFPGSAAIHWSFDDPAEETTSKERQLLIFRRVRDEILARLRVFVLANTD
jgi:arsenate reductase